MSESVRLLVQTLIAVGTSGLLYLFLTYRQQRRRIDAGATADEATAASTLSGAALLMVQNADARAERAEKAAETARAGTREAVKRANDLEDRCEELEHRCEDLEDEIGKLLRRETDLEDAMRTNGVEPPPRRRGYDQRPPVPQLPEDGQA